MPKSIYLTPQIREHRHFIAHSEKRSKEFLILKDIDPNFDNNYTKIRSLSKLVIFYIECVFENFSDIQSNAELTLKLKVQKNMKKRNKDAKGLKEYQKDIEKIIESTNSNLEKNGYKRAHSSLVL